MKSNNKAQDQLEGRVSGYRLEKNGNQATWYDVARRELNRVLQ